MRTCLLTLAIFASACSSSTVGSDAGDASDSVAVDGDVTDVAADAGPIQCNVQPSVFPNFDRSCNTAADCIIELHQVNCCGTEQAIGLRRDQQAAFDAAESTCRSQYPGCGCASGPLGTDNGNASVLSASAVQVQCQSGMCVTSPRAMQSCGSMTCGPTQVCVPGCCGVPGCTPPPSVCVDVPAACATNPSCSCFPSNPCPSGTCQGFDSAQVTCLCA